jgi:hypothetical protein
MQIGHENSSRTKMGAPGLDSETWESTTPSLSKDFVISGGAKRHSPLLLKLQCQNSPPL